MDQTLRDFVTLTAFGEFAQRTNVATDDILTDEVAEKLGGVFSECITYSAENEAKAAEIVRSIVREAVDRLISADKSVDESEDKTEVSAE